MMMIGIGTPSNQSRIPRPIVSSGFLRARAPAGLSADLAHEIDSDSPALATRKPHEHHLRVTTWSLGRRNVLNGSGDQPFSFSASFNTAAQWTSRQCGRASTFALAWLMIVIKGKAQYRDRVSCCTDHFAKRGSPRFFMPVICAVRRTTAPSRHAAAGCPEESWPWEGLR